MPHLSTGENSWCGRINTLPGRVADDLVSLVLGQALQWEETQNF